VTDGASSLLESTLRIAAARVQVGIKAPPPMHQPVMQPAAPSSQFAPAPSLYQQPKYGGGGGGAAVSSNANPKYGGGDSNSKYGGIEAKYGAGGVDASKYGGGGGDSKYGGSSQPVGGRSSGHSDFSSKYAEPARVRNSPRPPFLNTKRFEHRRGSRLAFTYDEGAS
jgi:hypothetical protein